MGGRLLEASVSRARDRFRCRRRLTALPATVTALLAACFPAWAQFDPGDLPVRVPPPPVFSIFDTLNAPERSPQGTTRESIAPLKNDRGAATAATCEARDASVAKLYARAEAALKQKESAEAAYWLKSGFTTRLDTNDGWALTRLGYIMISDDNPKRDPVVARILWELAAATGRGDAFYNLGYLFETGVGVQADPEKALAWYEKAQAFGYDKAAEAIRRLRAKP